VERLSEKFRVALVTGSSSGLGLAFTKHLLREGVAVVGLSRSPEIGEASGHYHPWPFDLADLAALPATLDAVFGRFPEIDLVINNAGFGVLEHLQEQSEAQIEAQFNVMLGAPTLIAKRALSQFAHDGTGGCLCNVSSLAVELPLPLMPVYNACKGGLSALSQGLLLDASGADKNYTVIDFRPGDFNTNFGQRMTGQVYWNGVDLRAVMDRHHASAPSETRAVKKLHRALLNGCSGTVRVGDFFQSYLAPLGARFLSQRNLRGMIRAYYKR
jgi:short-subunit dehydrogenase